MKESLETFFSKPGKDKPSPQETKCRIKNWKKKARADQKEEARFDYDVIIKKAGRLKPFEKRIEFVEDSIDQVRIKRTEENQKFTTLLRNGDLVDPESTQEYLDSLALTVRKLKIFLRHEKSSTPEMKGHGGSRLLKPSEDAVDNAEKQANKVKKVMSAKEVSSAYGIPLNTLYKMTTEQSKRNGKGIPHHHVGKKHVFIPAEIEEWLKQR